MLNNINNNNNNKLPSVVTNKSNYSRTPINHYLHPHYPQPPLSAAETRPRLLYKFSISSSIGNPCPVEGRCMICDVGGEFIIIIIINIIQHVSPCCYLTTFGLLTAREIKVSPSCYFTTFEIITGRARVSCLPSLNNRRFWGNNIIFKVYTKL